MCKISEREYLFTVELYPEQYQYTPPLPTEIPRVAEHDFSPSPKPGQLLLSGFPSKIMSECRRFYETFGPFV